MGKADAERSLERIFAEAKQEQQEAVLAAEQGRKEDDLAEVSFGHF